MISWKYFECVVEFRERGKESINRFGLKCPSEIFVAISGTDQSIRGELAETILDGIEDGIFRDVDAEPAADRLYTLLLGGFLRRMTTDDTDLKAIQDDAYECIDGSRTE